VFFDVLLPCDVFVLERKSELKNENNDVNQNKGTVENIFNCL